MRSGLESCNKDGQREGKVRCLQLLEIIQPWRAWAEINFRGLLLILKPNIPKIFLVK